MVEEIPPLYAVIHIPKAAGKTFRWIATRQFEPHQEFKMPKRGWRGALPLAELPPDLRLITDVPSMDLNRIMGVPVRYLTMLRHPLQRGLSFYRYDHPDGDFSDFKIPNLMADNAMTRAMAGVKEPGGEVSGATLRKAMRNIEQHCAFVGVTERFDECMVLLRRLLGWNCILYQSRNVSTGSSRHVEPPARVVRKILVDNEYDLELYEFARSRLDTMIAAQRPDFRVELEAFKRLLASEAGTQHGTHEKPPKLGARAFRQHVKRLVNEYHAEGHKDWREFRTYTLQLAEGWQRRRVPEAAPVLQGNDLSLEEWMQAQS